MKARTLLTAALMLALTVASLAAPAHGARPLVLEATYASPANGWDKVERWRDDNTGFIPAHYPADGRVDQGGQSRTFFGNVGRPTSNRYLLSYAPGWNTNPKQTPVQMLKRWDATHPLNIYADSDALANYNGGWGYYSYSHGIDYAINQGSVINPMRSAGVPSSIATYLLCGNAANIPAPWHNEHAGPSDGTIFTASCSDAGGIGTLSGTATFNNLNHLQLPWATTSSSQIRTWLN